MADNALYFVDDDQVLDAEWLNRLLGDVHTRIRAIEGIKASLTDAISELTAVGLGRIDQTLVPVIEETKADLALLLQHAQADVDAIEIQLAASQQQIADLLAGGVPAANVTENATRVFLTPAEKAQIQTTAEALALATTNLIASIDALNSAKAPKASPDFSGSVAFTTAISPAALTADQNDFNPTNLSSAMTVRLQAAQTRTITGLKAGRSGEFKLIDNVGAGDLVLTSEATASTAANRFALGGDFTLKPSQSVMLRYDATAARWRAVANVVRQTTPIGTRAQIDLPPPLPWLACNGGTFISTAYPLLAQKFGVDVGLTGTVGTATWASLGIGVDATFTNIGLGKGLGFYWALFWRAESGTNLHTLRCYKAADPLGAWSLVFSEADVTNGQAAGQQASFDGILSPGQIEFAEGFGVFSLGNTLIVLEAATYTIRRNYFADATWNATYSKLACYHATTASWIFIERGANPPIGETPNPKTGALGFRGTVSGFGLVTPRRLVSWNASVWLLNGANQEVGGLFKSANGITGWSTMIAQDTNAGAKDLIVAGNVLYAVFSNGTSRGLHRSSDGLTFTKQDTSATSTAALGIDTAQGAYVVTWESGAVSYFNRSNLKAAIATGATAQYRLAAVYDEVNGGLITSTGAQRSYVTLSANPVTQSLLPTVATTPTTYIFGG